MKQTSSQVAARLAEIYKGVAGYHILNKSGQLGYISGDGTRLSKEPLDGIAADKAVVFFDELARAVRASPPGADQELGYLLPADDAHAWRTATLVLHEHVAKALKDAFERTIAQGQVSLEAGQRRAAELAPERGLYQGFEDLLNHVGSFGVQTYFPVLYIRLETESPLRMVNLMSILPASGRFADIFAQLRLNLVERGVLSHASRVEHRFTLEGDDG